MICVCNECKQTKKHKAHGLCASCYVLSKPKIICKNCLEKKPHAAKGLCHRCYTSENYVKCVECEEIKPHHAKDLCGNCYHKEAIVQRKEVSGIYQCIDCDKIVEYYLKKGRCRRCYYYYNLILCAGCGEKKPHAGQGLCGNCYSKIRKIIKCKDCEGVTQHQAFNLCKACYYKVYSKEKNEQRSLY